MLFGFPFTISLVRNAQLLRKFFLAQLQMSPEVA